jgi:hypothetical protein
VRLPVIAGRDGLEDTLHERDRGADGHRLEPSQTNERCRG